MGKILLLGEFSGVHLNLKRGLQEFGYEVTIASNGDGGKRIAADIDLTSVGKTKIGKYFRLIKMLTSFSGYDVVQFINPYISHRMAVLLCHNIFKNNDRVFCLAAGDDVEFTRFVKNNGLSKYSPFDYELKHNVKLPYSDIIDVYLHNDFMKRVDGIIPIMYEYAESYRRSTYSSKLKRTIAMPIDLSSVTYTENKVRNGKIKIYHGELRPLFKGTSYIIDAMNIVKRKYPNDVEIVYAKKLPLAEYLEVIRDVNIIMDQCRSYSYGMNAVYSMAQGKVVLSGSEKEALNEFNEDENPIINIQPNTDQIVKQLEFLIANKHKVRELGEESRRYVEQKHSHMKVTQQYLQTWYLKEQ